MSDGHVRAAVTMSRSRFRNRTAEPGFDTGAVDQRMLPAVTAFAHKRYPQQAASPVAVKIAPVASSTRHFTAGLHGEGASDAASLPLQLGKYLLGITPGEGFVVEQVMVGGLVDTADIGHIAALVHEFGHGAA